MYQGLLVRGIKQADLQHHSLADATKPHAGWSPDFWLVQAASVQSLQIWHGKDRQDMAYRRSIVGTVVPALTSHTVHCADRLLLPLHVQLLQSRWTFSVTRPIQPAGQGRAGQQLIALSLVEDAHAAQRDFSTCLQRLGRIGQWLRHPAC